MLEQLLRVGKIKKVSCYLPVLAVCIAGMHFLDRVTLQAYLVIRTKRGESQQKRLKTILQSPVFRLHHEPQKFRQVCLRCSLLCSFCQAHL